MTAKTKISLRAWVAVNDWYDARLNSMYQLVGIEGVEARLAVLREWGEFSKAFEPCGAMDRDSVRVLESAEEAVSS